ncbi:MAG: hypothetical protein ABIT76_10295 [Chthoniobacterales bacterium]
MKTPLRFSRLGACLFAGLMTLHATGWSQGAPSQQDKAQTLLQEVKNRELDRQRAEKMKEVERLNEDLEKDKREAEDLKQSVVTMDKAVTDSQNRLTQLMNQKKQFAKMMEVAGLQIDAETLKVEGLKMLSDAQSKQVVALAKRVEEKEVRGAIEKAKMMPTKNTGEGSSADFDRKLDRAERATSTARVDAREAMTAATAKLQAASAADEKARARAAELGIPIRGEPAPTQENVEPLQEVDPMKEADPAAAADPTKAAPSPGDTENYPRAVPLHPEKLPKTP